MPATGRYLIRRHACIVNDYAGSSVLFMAAGEIGCLQLAAWVSKASFFPGRKFNHTLTLKNYVKSEIDRILRQ